MNFIYETDRLYIQILNGTYAAQCLRFYQDDRELFERYEALRPDNFYTESYHRYLMNYEYNRILRGDLMRYYFFPKDDVDRMIGTVSLRNIVHGAYDKCEIGYKISSDYQGQGYAHEGIGRVLQIAFEELELRRIEAYCMPDNAPSIHLLESLDFLLEGRLRKYVQINGQYEDHLIYSLLRD